jgi:hypothetical protein
MNTVPGTYRIQTAGVPSNTSPETTGTVQLSLSAKGVNNIFEK